MKAVTTKEELFTKYKINESHAVWDDTIDNWISVEIYRLMHNGELPDLNDLSVNWIIDFIDKFNTDREFKLQVMKRNDFGSIFLTSKRMIYRYADIILEGVTS